MSAFRKTLLAAALLAGVLVVAGPASAAKPDSATGGKGCGNALIRDWYDGRIDKTYPVHCYQDALKHLPNDVRNYSDAWDVISRALADATRGEKKADPDKPVPPPSEPTTSSTTTHHGTTTTTPGNPSASGRPNDGGPIGGVLNGGDQGANGVPIPLIVLAGLALLLVAAGGAGLVARRIQSRRGGP
jgi:hypothetical protein